MKLVIGQMNHQMQNFIRRSTFSEKMLLINKMCNVKSIKDDVSIIIPYGIIMKNGLISNTQVHLEELLISLNVINIFYTNPYNKVIFEKLQSKYHFQLFFIDINNTPHMFF